MQRIQNYFILGTQLLGLAFSERFELNWVVGLFKLGGNREREMGWIVFGVGQLCKKRGNCISGSGASPDGTDHNE